jgi:hypothetical protein
MHSAWRALGGGGSRRRGAGLAAAGGGRRGAGAPRAASSRRRMRGGSRARQNPCHLPPSALAARPPCIHRFWRPTLSFDIDSELRVLMESGSRSGTSRRSSLTSGGPPGL